MFSSPTTRHSKLKSFIILIDQSQGGSFDFQAFKRSIRNALKNFRQIQACCHDMRSFSQRYHGLNPTLTFIIELCIRYRRCGLIGKRRNHICFGWTIGADKLAVDIQHADNVVSHQKGSSYPAMDRSRFSNFCILKPTGFGLDIFDHLRFCGDKHFGSKHIVLN